MSKREASPRDVELIAAAVARLRAGIMALVFAFCGGLGLFLATVWLLVRGGPNVGEHLGLLANYFPGYSRELGGLAARSRLRRAGGRGGRVLAGVDLQPAGARAGRA